MTKTDASIIPTCPGDRLSCPTIDRDGRKIVNTHTYIPFFLSSVNNALSRGASNLYREMFGVGIVEWRTIAMLAIEPRITANRICEVIHLDKAATSRALRQLLGDGHVDFLASETDERKRVWWLSPSGYDLHERILTVALQREARLIQGVDPHDLEAFLRVMRRMQQNISDV